MRPRAYLYHYDITKDADMTRPVDFNRRGRLQHVDRVFKADITGIVELTEQEKLFQVRILDPVEREGFSFMPGQFVMVDVPGFGEIPISISSSPSLRGYMELCIRKAGLVTGVLHKVQRGARIGIRGPFGTYFPVERMKGHNVLLIAGGLGMAPLRSPLFYITENRPDYRDVQIMYGTRSPSQLLFSYQYDQWRRIDGVNLQIIVDHPDPAWKGDVGVITKLFDRIEVSPYDTFAIVCGPPVMFKFVCSHLNRLGVPMDRMYVSLERRMHCGMGKCCRCHVGSTYTCLDGPVFDYWTVMNLKEAI